MSSCPVLDLLTSALMDTRTDRGRCARLRHAEPCVVTHSRSATLRRLPDFVAIVWTFWVGTDVATLVVETAYGARTNGGLAEKENLKSYGATIITLESPQAE